MKYEINEAIKTLKKHNVKTDGTHIELDCDYDSNGNKIRRAYIDNDGIKNILFEIFRDNYWQITGPDNTLEIEKD